MPLTFDILAQAMDALGAALPQYVPAVAFYGERPASAEATAGEPDARKIALTVRCMVVEDAPVADADAIGPTTERLFTVIFPASSWRAESSPQIGEWVRFCPFANAAPIWGKVANVTRMPTGSFKLSVSHLPRYETTPPLNQ